MTTREYLALNKKCPFYTSVPYEDMEEDQKAMKEYNQALTDKYIWLVPKSRWTGEVDDDYDYEYTELDDMPAGWRIAFGDQMCEEIHQALKEEHYEKSYEIAQIKEKFGELRWYDNGAPQSVFDIISKYEKLSRTTCICCGKPAKWISRGWISPFCDDCKDDREFYIPIEECSEKPKGSK